MQTDRIVRVCFAVAAAVRFTIAAALRRTIATAAVGLAVATAAVGLAVATAAVRLAHAAAVRLLAIATAVGLAIAAAGGLCRGCTHRHPVLQGKQHVQRQVWMRKGLRRRTDTKRRNRG